MFRGHDRCRCVHPMRAAPRLCCRVDPIEEVQSVVVHILAEAGTLDAAWPAMTPPSNYTTTTPPHPRSTSTPSPATPTNMPQKPPPTNRVSPWPWDTPTNGDGDNTPDDDEDPPWSAPGPGAPPPPPDHPDTSTATTPDTGERADSPAPDIDGAASNSATPDTPTAKPLPLHTCPPAVSTRDTSSPPCYWPNSSAPAPPSNPTPTHSGPEPHYQFSDQLRAASSRCATPPLQLPRLHHAAEKLDIDHTIAHADHGHAPPSTANSSARTPSPKPSPPPPDNGPTNNCPTATSAGLRPRLERPASPRTRSQALFPELGLHHQHHTLHPPNTRRRAATPTTPMPTRQRTRQHDRAQRITTEREHNALLRALDTGPPTRSPFR